MKAISIKQPWAGLVATGVKDVENRTWSTTHRGPILVCASKTPDKVAYANYDRATLTEDDPEAWADGMAVGIVDIVDVVRDHLSGWAEPDCWHFVLANARRITPFPVRGQLGIYDVKLAEGEL